MFPVVSNSSADALSRLQVGQFHRFGAARSSSTLSDQSIGLAHLDTMIGRLHCHALAPSTMSSYSTGVRSYLRFCGLMLLPALPLSESTLQRFVAFLHHRLAFKSIKVYLSGAQFSATMRGGSVSISSMSRLYYLLRGIRRLQGRAFQRPRRLPITMHHMRLIHHRVQFLCYSPFERLLFRTMSSLAFFGLLRCSEYTCSSRSSFSTSTALLVPDITFSPNFSIMYVFIRASKTDPFRTGCTIRIAAVSDPMCPVALMQQFLRVHPVGSGPLFTFSPGRYLTRPDVVNFLLRVFTVLCEH